MDNGKARIYVEDGILVIEKYAAERIERGDQQWILDAIAPHRDSGIPMVIWKRARYVLAPEAMQLIARSAHLFRGEVVYAGSDAVPEPDDNFAGRTYMRAKAPQCFPTFDAAKAYLKGGE